MPPGTPPQKVLAAVRNLAREEFYGQHRYALVLHTDEPHPHVHVVLKAVSEDGVRLNIRKATLREWRSKFAHNLRRLGVQANATERAVRGQDRKAKKDGIYRASLRGDSSFLREQAEAAARELTVGIHRPDISSNVLIETRDRVVAGWSVIAAHLKEIGEQGLAGDVTKFLSSMSSPRTDRRYIADKLRGPLSRSEKQIPTRGREPSR